MLARRLPVQPFVPVEVARSHCVLEPLDAPVQIVIRSFQSVQRHRARPGIAVVKLLVFLGLQRQHRLGLHHHRRDDVHNYRRPHANEDRRADGERACPENVEAVILGKALAHADELEPIALSLGVTPFLKFYGGAWRQPAKGLATVRALIAHVRANPSAVQSVPVDYVLSDLEEWERVLLVAEENKVRWHMAIDY